MHPVQKAGYVTGKLCEDSLIEENPYRGSYHGGQNYYKKLFKNKCFGAIQLPWLVSLRKGMHQWQQHYEEKSVVEFISLKNQDHYKENAAGNYIVKNRTPADQLSEDLEMKFTWPSNRER